MNKVKTITELLPTEASRTELSILNLKQDFNGLFSFWIFFWENTISSKTTLSEIKNYKDIIMTKVASDAFDCVIAAKVQMVHIQKASDCNKCVIESITLVEANESGLHASNPIRLETDKSYLQYPLRVLDVVEIIYYENKNNRYRKCRLRKNW